MSSPGDIRVRVPDAVGHVVLRLFDPGADAGMLRVPIDRSSLPGPIWCGSISRVCLLDVVAHVVLRPFDAGAEDGMLQISIDARAPASGAYVVRIDPPESTVTRLLIRR